jgi:hypothetical protein
MENTQRNTERTMALVAGLSLVAMAVFAGWGYGYAFGSIYVANDSASTLTNLNHSTALFRGFIGSFVAVLLLDVIVAWSLYIFFKPVHAALSLLSAWLRLVYAALLGIAILNLVIVLPLLTNVPQNEVLIMNCLESFLAMWSLGLIVFGVYLFVLGYLVLQSGFIPKVFGWLILLAAACYVGSNVANLMMSDYNQYKTTVDMVLGLPMAVGELSIAFWLLFKGGKTK